MGEQYIFTIENLSKAYAKREVLKNIWLAFYPGAKIGVIGSNGAGKSTLLRIMALAEKDFLGSARPAEGIRIGFVPQEPRLDETKDVRGNIEEAVASTRALLHRHEEISARLAEPLDPKTMEKVLEDLGKVQDAIDACNAWELDRQLEIAMDAMRLPPGEASATTLSGGERRRVALCKTLLQKPDLLLLDEPTNHLDAESVAWLERHLKEYPGTVVAVTHDRYFLDNVAGWILELDRGQGIPWKGNYSSWLEQKQQRLAKEEKQAVGSPQSPGPRAGMGPDGAAGAGGQEQGPPQPSMKSWPARNTRSARTSWFYKSRPVPTWATWWCGPRAFARAMATTSSWRT